MGGARVEADRHVGAETERGLPKIACVLGAEPPQSGEAAQHRSRIGRAAAEAGRNRDALVERDSHIGGAAELLRQRRRRPRRQIVARIQGAGERAGYAEAEGFGRRDLQRVGERGEGDEAVQLVIAVGAAAGHMEVEVELGRRPDPNPHFSPRSWSARRYPADREGTARSAMWGIGHAQ